MIKISRFRCEYFIPRMTKFVEGCIPRRYQGRNFMLHRPSSILNICSIYLQALVCSLSALWWLPQHTQRGWGEVSWYLAVSLHWRYNSGVRKFLNNQTCILNKLNFAGFLLLLCCRLAHILNTGPGRFFFVGTNFWPWRRMENNSHGFD